jgi:hypothetical protein
MTQRDLLMEMRGDIRALRSVVESVALDQALSVERRASMQRVADAISAQPGLAPEGDPRSAALQSRLAGPAGPTRIDAADARGLHGQTVRLHVCQDDVGHRPGDSLLR